MRIFLKNMMVNHIHCDVCDELFNLIEDLTLQEKISKDNVLICVIQVDS